MRPDIARSELPTLVGLALALAGVALLAQGLVADLSSHAASHHSLAAQLTPHDAALVEVAEARENANPWHLVLAAGQVLLTGGLLGLYLSERRHRQALQRPARRRPDDQPTPDPERAAQRPPAALTPSPSTRGSG
jgi:hypothetical protein